VQKWNRWQDWANVGLGVILFITPFVFGAMANTTAAWTAYIGGVLLVIVGLFDLTNPDSQAGEWTEGVLGLLVFVSPWVLGFSGLTMIAGIANYFWGSNGNFSATRSGAASASIGHGPILNLAN